MRQLFTFILSFLFVVSFTAQDLIITGAYDGPLSGGTPKGVELYVINDISDLSIYGIGSANNGGGTDGEEYTFPSDAVTAGTFLYVTTDTVPFNDFFGFDPQYETGSMSINGDDAVELFMNGGVIDVFGDINTDGTGEAWDHVDGWAYRKDGTGPDGSTFTIANWTFSGPDAFDGETSNATAATPFPIGTFEYSVSNFTPSITNISMSPEEPTSSDAVTISATITDSDGTISSANVMWGTTSGSLTNSVAMTNSGDTYSAVIPAQADLTTVYYIIEATDDAAATSESSEYEYTVFDAQTTTLPYSEDFESGFNQVYTYSESGDTKDWYITGGAASANGYNSGDVEIDWLILPAIDLDSYTGEKITFDTWNRFATIDDDNYLKLLYSINYTGLGDPSLATWTELTFAIPSAEQTWTASGNVDLSGITGANVYLAFKYAGTAGSYTWWQVDNVSITSSGATDIDKIDASALSIYPNPTYGTINFTAKSANVEVYNLVGKEVYSATNVKSIDLSGFEKGVYVVKAKADGASVVQKVILK